MTKGSVKLFSLILGFTLSGHLASAGFTDSDVSVLYPIAQIAFEDYYLGLSAAKANGELLSQNQYKTINDLVIDNNGSVSGLAGYNRFKVLSIRIDPCSFRPQAPCEPEIRLVAQTHHMVGFNESALHLVYQLTSNEFDQLTRDYQKLLDLHPVPTAPELGIQPRFSVDEKNDFQKGFENLILQSIGQKNIYRVALMSRFADEWVFMNLDADHSSAEPTLTPAPFPHGHGATMQIFRGSEFTTDPNLNSSVNFEPNTGFPNIVGDLMRKQRLLTAQELALKDPTTLNANETQYLDRYEKIHTFARDMMTDTQRFNRFNTDCFSCHAGAQALKFSQRLFADNFANQSFPFIEAAWPSVYSTDEKPNSIIAFGYINQEPSVSDRTRQESQEVADKLNSL
ncbi:MAG: hypothetical protein KDD33_11685 [Bdellovibrionales bacterium]|nr:hypothetical protein [Bdellovibrionales bacterium]